MKILNVMFGSALLASFSFDAAAQPLRLEDHPDVIRIARATISSLAATDNQLPPQLTPDRLALRETAQKLVDSIVEGLNGTADKNTIASYSVKLPDTGTVVSLSALIPASRLPKNTPVALCISRNGQVTSAWSMARDNAVTEKAPFAANTPEQSGRPACFNTLIAVKHELDKQLLVGAPSK